MTTTMFEYKVRDESGKLVTGRLEGDTVPFVAQRLREMGYVPVGIEPTSRLNLHQEIHLPFLGDRVKLKDVAVMSRQLATMVASGLSLIRSLGLLADQVSAAPLRDAVVQVRAEVERGSALSDALGGHPKVFDQLYVSMVRAGEVSGQLDEVLNKLATAIEKRVALRSKVRSAMTYPVVMVFVAIAVVIAMMIAVVPTFARLYGQFHGSLPVPTRLVIGISHLLASVWAFVLLAGLIGATFGVRRWLGTERGRRVFDRTRLRIPIFGPLSHKLSLERVASMLGSLLASGVGIIEALDLAAENSGNVLVAEAITYARAAVREGRTLGAALAECPVIPPMFTQMVETGEESGAVGELLDKVATFYRDEIDSTVNGLTSLLEPVMVVVMGAVIGSIVVSLYLPMFKYITLVSGTH